MLGNLGPGEMVFILLVLLLIFGARRLPEIGSSLGRGIREFKKSMTDIQAEINRPDQQPPVQPAPVQAIAAQVAPAQQVQAVAAAQPAVPPAPQAAPAQQLPESSTTPQG